MKSVTLLLMGQPHTPQFHGQALKQGHLCPNESRGQLPAFLHTLRLSRSQLCHLWTQQCGLNTKVRIELSVKMEITVKTQTTGYGHPQKKRRRTCKGQDFPVSFVFQSQSISKPRLQRIASGTPPPNARVHLHGRNPLYLVNSTLISNTLTIHTVPYPRQHRRAPEATELGNCAEPPREPPHHDATQLHGPHPFSFKVSGE